MKPFIVLFTPKSFTSIQHLWPSLMKVHCFIQHWPNTNYSLKKFWLYQACAKFGAWAFDKIRKYQHRISQLNWGPKIVHFGKTHFKEPNINAQIVWPIRICHAYLPAVQCFFYISKPFWANKYFTYQKTNLIEITFATNRYSQLQI